MRRLGWLAAAAFVAACVTTARGQSLAATPPPEAAVIYAAGDLIQCETSHLSDATGRLMEALLDLTPHSFGITLGDNSNDDGSEQDYECLDRSAWGRLRARVWPTPGNHDYGTDKVLPYYYLYFVNAGPPGLGYYAYDAGPWRVYALNSELTGALRDQQLEWLEGDLKTHAPRQCTMAYFHRPPFSSGRFASPAWTMPMFRKLYKYGVDLVATGHEHFFAALPPLTPDGTVDQSFGVPLLIAGTGGAVMFERPRTLRYGKYGETLVENTRGILKITLRRSSYDWAFLPADAMGSTPPSGSGTCHDNPSGYAG